MQPLQLFDMAFRQNEWLAKRQSVIASNIANVNTPGYKAQDVTSFDEVMRSSLPMAVTDAGHIGASATDGETVQAAQGDNTEVVYSGNNVNLEQEFLKSGEVMRNYSTNTQVLKAFNRMLLMATKV